MKPRYLQSPTGGKSQTWECRRYRCRQLSAGDNQHAQHSASSCTKIHQTNDNHLCTDGLHEVSTAASSYTLHCTLYWHYLVPVFSNSKQSPPPLMRTCHYWINEYCIVLYISSLVTLLPLTACAYTAMIQMSLIFSNEATLCEPTTQSRFFLHCSQTH